MYLQERHAKNLPASHGVFLCLTLFSTFATQSIIFHQYFNINSTVEALIRGSLISSVYEKSCRLSPQSRSLYTSGQIQNLMSTDSRTVAEVVLYIHMLWSSLEQVTVAMFLLSRLLGWIPTFVGVGFLLAVLPLQSYMISVVRSTRERASSFTDERVKLVSEVVRAIKLVKLYAWELSFVKRILATRAQELNELRCMAIFMALNTVTYAAVPTVLTITVFATYSLLGNVLDAAAIFPALVLFNILRPAMAIFPSSLVSAARASASLSRLSDFFLAEELTPLVQSAHAVNQEELMRNEHDAVAQDAAFTWDTSTSGPPTLSSVTLAIPQGSLVAIVGPTGSGKSTLLAGLLGEVPIVDGKAGLREGCSVAFCDQVAFIQNATLRDNILFGKSYNEGHYRDTLRVCCLEPDLVTLPAGDMTEIGGRGINLSGGQRARVSLARAVYARSDILLFDDPLSAVDAHVGSSIFYGCIVEQLKGKTRLLATNQIQFAASSEVDMVVVVREGKIVEAGEREALMADSSSEFSQLLELCGENGYASSNDTTEEDEGDVEIQEMADVSIPRPVTSSPEDGKKSAVTPLSDRTSDKPGSDYGAVENGQLTRRERKEKGRVSWRYYSTYFSAMGFFQWALPALVFLLGSQGFLLGLNVWLSQWSSDSVKTGTSDVLYYLTVFLVLGIVSVILSGLSSFCVAFGSIRASVVLHEKLVLSVLGAPSSFFNANPQGRIVNRFNADLEKLDSTLAGTLQATSRLGFSLCFTLCLVIWATPLLIIVAIPVIVACLYVQEYYRKTSVDLRRLESLARSPLYSHFSETLDGVVTLRAFGDMPRASHMNSVYIDQLNRTMYSSSYANRWLGIRLEALGTILILSATLLAVLGPTEHLSASLIGLVLSYIMQILGQMTWTVRQFTDMESQMSAMERVYEYSEPPFPQEENGGLRGFLLAAESDSRNMKSDTSLGLISPATMSQLNRTVGHKRGRWPRKGLVEFENIQMRYREDLSPALRNMSLTVRGGEHIGIVGRTGAGKSSAIQCLFRLYELDKGRITIDGVDVSKLRLHDLRSALGVIPQEAVCFSGTIRSNLDMFEEYEDEEVQRVLEACGLQDTMREEVSLDSEVAENGSNLSVGQRQLLCLGRALLKDSQVLVLDEATSNISNEMDSKIQETLRREMSHCTVLTVAHRLHTVMRSDRIVVMDKGRIAEMGKPSELLSRRSMLSDLVDETGPATAGHLRELAAQPRYGSGGTADGGGVGWKKAGGKEGGSSVAREVRKEMMNGGGGKMGVVVRGILSELGSVVEKMEVGAVRREVSRALVMDEGWRERFALIISKLNVVSEGVGEGMVDVNFDKVVMNGGGGAEGCELPDRK